MSREGLLLTKLRVFYEKPNNIKILNDIITKRDNVSLRNIEWFVTTYCRKKKVTYKTGGKDFTVHMSYKSSLDGYSKKLFDPFCRTQRIEFNKLTTTVAQLNFIKWCIENEIIEYIITNKTDLFKKTA